MPRNGSACRLGTTRLKIKSEQDKRKEAELRRNCSWRCALLTMSPMKLPPELEFHEDIRLLIYRPHGVIDEAAVKRIVDVLEELEAELQKPFNRFFDTLAADEVELNFKYVIRGLSLSAPVVRGASTGEVGNSRYRCNHDSLREIACLTDSGFSYQRPCIPGPKRSRGLVQRTGRTADIKRVNLVIDSRTTKTTMTI